MKNIEYINLIDEINKLVAKLTEEEIKEVIRIITQEIKKTKAISR